MPEAAIQPVTYSADVGARIAKMQRLIDSFPSLRRLGLAWIGDDNASFIRQARATCYSSGEHHSAAFVLYVWNRLEAPKGFRFDFDKAIQAWDDEHVEALRSWMARIWYA